MKNLILKKSLLILVCLFAFTATKAQLQYLNSPDQVRAFTKKEALLLKDNKVSEFFKEARQYWPLAENELANVEEKTIQGFNLLSPRFGETEEVVKVREEKVKDFSIRETYYIKYQYSIIRLIFTYYKNNKGWILNGFTWDGKLSEEFKDVQ